MTSYINYNKPYNKTDKKIATTKIVKSNQYILLNELLPDIELEVFNQDKKEYYKANYYIAIILEKPKKRDTILKITY